MNTPLAPVLFGQHLKVLIADDDRNTRYAHRLTIDHLARPEDTYEFLEAANVAEAEETLSKEKNIDLVLTHNYMPRENDGIRLLEKIRDLVGRKQIKPPYTAMVCPDIDARRLALKAGADEVLVIPDVLAGLRKILQKLQNPSDSADKQ